MKATDRGLILNRAELACLLAYTGEGELNRVHFKVGTGPLGELEAYATDSRVAVLGISGEVFTGAQGGEWLVDGRFLKKVLTNLPKDGQGLLRIEGQNLFSAEIFKAKEDPDADLFAPDDLGPPIPPEGSLTLIQDDNAVILQTEVPGCDPIDRKLQGKSKKGEPTKHPMLEGLEDSAGDYSAASRVEISTVALGLTRHLSSVVMLDSVVMRPGREASDVVRFIAQAPSGKACWFASVLPPSRWTGEDENKEPEPKQTKQVSMFEDAPKRSAADLATALANEVEKLPPGCSVKFGLGSKTIEIGPQDAAAIRQKAQEARQVDLSKRVKKPTKGAKVADLSAERAKRSSKKGGK